MPIKVSKQIQCSCMVDNSFSSHMHTPLDMQTGPFFCHKCMWTTATPH